ncbi:TetR/AcrR family transcriptional regulator [Patulibacter sp. NPDC049589]|uniref:TetR/AcrR family transcriptional regulator n=1 Tax=Patulibacter sp. NPDC049589 TaxID=3154731 RepID=UPI003414666C
MTRQRKILDVAAQLFHERGFHGVGIDEIGRRAGVSGPAVYRHFKGKDEILATVFDEAMDLVTVRPNGEFATPRDELDFLIRAHASFVVDHRALVSVFAHEHRFLVDPWRRLFTRRMRDHAAYWEETIARCYPDASPEAVAIGSQAAIGLLHSVVYWPAQTRSATDLVEWLVRLVLDGLDALSVPAGATAPARPSSAA